MVDLYLVAQYRGALGDRTAEDLGGKMCCDGMVAENYNGMVAENQDGTMAEDDVGKTTENQVDAIGGTQGDDKAEDIDSMTADDLDSTPAETLDGGTGALELSCVMAPLMVENVHVQMLVGLEGTSLMCSL